MDNNYNTPNDILQDRINGKVVPWRPKKKQALVLARSFHRLGKHKKANRVWWCSYELEFRVEPETGRKRLEKAGFCRERLCSMCAWRRSLKTFHQVSKVMDEVERRHKNLQPIFLTLTVKNCEGSGLADTLDMMFNGWGLLRKHRKIKRVVHGWFRALEVTYNRKDDTYHPHFHAILLVDKSYFKGKDYMQTTDWVQMWRTACALDYDPICDIRKVRVSKGKYKAVAEIAKYTVKDSDYLHKDNNKLTDELVSILSSALSGRQLHGFGGVMRVIAKELGMKKLGGGDLVHIDGDAIRDDVAKLIEVYKWSFGVANYIRRR